MSRTKIADRLLPDYTRGEELCNTVSHAAGGVLAIVMLVLAVVKAVRSDVALAVPACAVYGATLLLVYTMSSVYHGAPRGRGKKVLQVLDHCAIYFLIAGTYTPLALCAFRPLYPTLGWAIFGVEWALALAATVFTAIDLKQYNTLSMICYLGMGWGVLALWPQAVAALGRGGFALLLWGGVAYTLGAVLYGLGSRRRYMHSVFHLFVIAGSVLHFFVVYSYVL